MANDPNQQTGQAAAGTAPATDDLQIKTPGASGVNPAGATTSAQPVVPSPAPAAQPAPSINLADADNIVTPNAQPVNKRAFNLEEGVEDSATGPTKPEKFAIPKMVKEKYPELIELIKTTESMDDQERQYWFQILPIMTPEQVEKFRNILVTEKNQLADLDKEYEDELNRLNEKHLLEWKEFESKEKSRAIKEAEAKSSEQEQKEEEDLLAKLGDV